MRNWTKREIEKLVNLTLDGIAIHEIARLLRAASTTVRALQIECGLVEEQSLRRRWTEEQLRVMRERYADESTAQLALELGRPVYSIYHAAKRMGLSKSAVYLASPAACRLRRGDEVGKDYRFKPGIVPHNKGKRQPGWAPGRMSETQFKKGERSGRAAEHVMPLGSTRLIDGYLYRKIDEIPNVPHTRNWRCEHFLIWEKVNGPIPSGHVLVFKDRDRTHIALDNLELISRADLARRNSIHNLPESLKEVIRLNASLKRRIRRIEREEQDDGSAQPLIRDTGGTEGSREAHGC